ncbi:MAG: MlaD family protein [Fibrobacterota bacterium]
MFLANRTIGYISLLALLVFLACFSSYVYFTQYHGIYYRTAYADDIGNLKIENPVKVHGLEAGKVWAISRENNQAKLTLRMQREFIIRKDYYLLNKDASLMGDRGLYLDLGASDTVLPDSVPLFAVFNQGIAEGIRSADTLRVIVDDLFTLLREYSAKDSLNDTLFITQYWKILRGLDQASRQLEAMVISKEKSINGFVDFSAGFMRETRTQVQTLLPDARSGIRKADAMAKSAAALLVKLEPLIDELTRYVDATSRGDNRIGKLIQDKDSREKLLKLIRQVRVLVGIMKEDGVGLKVYFF